MHTCNCRAENKAAGKESPGGKGVNSYRGDLSRCGGKANSSGGRARQTYFSPKTISASLKSFFTKAWSSLGQITSTNNGALFGRKINEIILAAGEKNLGITQHSIAVDVFRRGAAQLGPTADVGPPETTRLHKDIFALI